MELTPQLLARIRALRAEGLWICDIADHPDIQWTGSLPYLREIAGPMPRGLKGELTTTRPAARTANGELSYGQW